ncbi:hypothetical protein [Paraburkholderia sp.]|uniref:hypothetical protein n=1 Tax=Paraburkholderia sp. TaxID=1926495 RepID=UPI003D6F1784
MSKDSAERATVGCSMSWVSSEFERYSGKTQMQDDKVTPGTVGRHRDTSRPLIAAYRMTAFHGAAECEMCDVARREYADDDHQHARHAERGGIEYAFGNAEQQQRRQRCHLYDHCGKRGHQQMGAQHVDSDGFHDDHGDTERSQNGP